MQNIIQSLRRDSDSYTIESLFANLINESRGHTQSNEQIFTTDIQLNCRNRYRANRKPNRKPNQQVNHQSNRQANKNHRISKNHGKNL